MKMDDDGYSYSVDSEIEGDLEDPSTNISSTMYTSSETKVSEAEETVGKHENAVVFRLRVVVMLTILFTAVGVSLAVYFLTSKSEEELFEQQFEGAANKVLSSFALIIDNKFSAMGSLALQCSQFVKSQPNMSWPFVLVDDFQNRAYNARKLSGAVFTRIINIVEEEEREKWEAFAVEAGPQYLQDGREDLVKRGIDINALSRGEDGRRVLQGHSDGIEASLLDFSSGVANRIYNLDETFTPVVSKGPGPYFPLWEESPTYGFDLTNWDIRDFPAYSPYVKKVLETGDMTIAGLDVNEPGDTTYEGLGFTKHNSFLISIKNRGKLTYYDGSPMSTLFIPVFEDIDAPVEERKVVSILLSYFQWSVYFENLLSPNFPGVSIVLQNSCNSTYTYNLVGDQVVFGGEGDLHDTQFDEVKCGRLDSFKNGFGTVLNQEVCSYTLCVYPTQELKDEYVSNLPIIVTCAIAVVVRKRK